MVWFARPDVAIAENWIAGYQVLVLNARHKADSYRNLVGNSYLGSYGYFRYVWTAYMLSLAGYLRIEADGVVCCSASARNIHVCGEDELFGGPV